MVVNTWAHGAKGGGTFVKTRLPVESYISNWKPLQESVKLKIIGCVPWFVAFSLACTVSPRTYESLSVITEYVMTGVAGPTVSVLEDEGFPEDVMRVRSIR